MSQLKKRVLFLIGLVTLAIWTLVPISKAFNLGLDLRGGTYLTLQVDTSEAEDDVKDVDLVAVVADTIRRRVDAFGVAEAVVQKGANDTVIIQVPGVDTNGADRIKGIVMKQAFLEFSMVEDDERTVEKFKKSPRGVLKRNYRLLTMKSQMEGAEPETLLVNRRPEFTGQLLKSAYVSFGGGMGGTSVNLEFNNRGAKRFEKVTTDNANRRMAIILDGVIHSAPVIREPISGGVASITGNFTVDEAKDLAIVLQGGSLPLPVALIQENVVGPSLGQDSIRKGLRSSLLGLLLVFIFMFFYYRQFGVVANVALAINLLLLMMLLSFFDATLTLPGIAGIILTIGMAVDANVLIFERIKEEFKEGRSVKSAISIGFSKAFWAIFDSNVTTLLTGLILFKFGTGPVRGFAVTMSLGIFSSFFCAMFVSRLLVDLWEKRIRIPVRKIS